MANYFIPLADKEKISLLQGTGIGDSKSRLKMLDLKYTSADLGSAISMTPPCQEDNYVKILVFNVPVHVGDCFGLFTNHSRFLNILSPSEVLNGISEKNNRYLL